MPTIKILFRYLYIFLLFAILAIVLLSVIGGFRAKPKKKIELAPGVALDENSFIPSKIEPQEVGEGLTSVITYTLDASDVEKWTYFDFSKGGIVKDTEINSLDWDLAFRRAKILTNSGATNKNGKGGVKVMESTAFNDVDLVPGSGDFEVDYKPYNKAETENPALLKWYDYNFINHRLDPKPVVYLIRTADGRLAKMRILSFYCREDKAGCYTIQYVYQGAPPPPQLFSNSSNLL
jgi:hypothetical protein